MPNVRFSNRPVRIKHFQAIHQCSAFEAPYTPRATGFVDERDHAIRAAFEKSAPSGEERPTPPPGAPAALERCSSQARTQLGVSSQTMAEAGSLDAPSPGIAAPNNVYTVVTWRPPARTTATSQQSQPTQIKKSGNAGRLPAINALIDIL